MIMKKRVVQIKYEKKTNEKIVKSLVKKLSPALTSLAKK